MSHKLFDLARSKLHVPPSARDSLSLHRWVLLKNSIVSHTPPLPDDPDEPDELDTDAFMFPDAGKLASGPTPDGGSTSEAQWLDSLLETLGGDDDDDDFAAVSRISIHVDDDDDNDNDDQLSPVGSPVSSSDDLLITQFPHHVPYPYPVPYPPFHPPLIYPCELDHHSSFDSFSALPYDEPLPYYDAESSSVPDAIEDTSDDESTDAPTTPSLGRSRNEFLDPAPPRSRLRHAHPHVHVDPDDPYYYPFELDPLPFPHEHQPYNNNYHEC
ncbi:hypothetical protein J132_02790 [Termitomyces sp. J132]|nr:hypothetical protein H2248_009868 [Termitomyces sp. 'cryptogamus']KNZ75457.1 hypothetical protein J132_02790 [Termitomyces sp. J132]